MLLFKIVNKESVLIMTDSNLSFKKLILTAEFDLYTKALKMKYEVLMQYKSQFTLSLERIMWIYFDIV